MHFYLIRSSFSFSTALSELDKKAIATTKRGKKQVVVANWDKESLAERLVQISAMLGDDPTAEASPHNLLQQQLHEDLESAAAQGAGPSAKRVADKRKAALPTDVELAAVSCVLRQAQLVLAHTPDIMLTTPLLNNGMVGKLQSS